MFSRKISMCFYLDQSEDGNQNTKRAAQARRKMALSTNQSRVANNTKDGNGRRNGKQNPRTP